MGGERKVWVRDGGLAYSYLVSDAAKLVGGAGNVLSKYSYIKSFRWLLGTVLLFFRINEFKV